MNRRTFLGLGCLAAAGCAVPRAAWAAPGARPNVLLILVDDLGYGDISCYGAADIETPNIDALMAGGMRFNRFRANSPVCSPTRAALLTGRYPELVGVPGVIRHYERGNWGYLSPDAVMLPSLFRQQGYRTTHVGKWHLGLDPENHPNRRGFDAFHGWLADMIDSYWKHRRGGRNYMRRDDEVIDPGGHVTDLFTDWSIEALRSDAAAGRPWFQYLAYTAPHFPVEPPPAWLERVKAREQGIDETRAKLVALIEHLDDGVGRVLKALEETGQRDNTIVVFASDNGGDLKTGARNAPWRSGKGHVYEGGLMVPACVSWPGRVRPGGTDFRALTMDVLPTLADLCGVPVEHDIEGRSFGKLLCEGAQPPFQRPVFFYWLQGKVKSALCDGDWKLVHDEEDAPYELYHLVDDPAEANDRAKDEPERLAAMIRQVEAHVARARGVPWKRPKT